MKLEEKRYFIINFVFIMIFILILETINLKLNRIDIKLSFFILPIIFGIIIGMIITYLSKSRIRYLEEKIREKTEEFEYYATMDDMTNTYNRRMGMNMLEYQFLVSKRYRDIFSICYLDINDLKSVNDKLGHDKGDEVIRKTSEMLRSSVRETDIVARMGGDEFLIILPNCEIEGAKKVIKRLLKNMGTYNEGIQRCYKISVSFGFSESSLSDKKTVEDMLVEADKKMYAMKKISKKQRKNKEKEMNQRRLKNIFVNDTQSSL